MKVPLVDLAAQHAEVADEVKEGWQRVIDRSAYILGDEVETFETEFSRFSGVPHCVAVANGTDALELALRASGVGPGDEVVLPVNTFIATAGAVARAGATPIFVDVDSASYLIDVGRVPEALSPRTRAVIPVHLFGQLAPMEELIGACGGHGVTVVEDAAQSHGATRFGKPAGRLSAAAATSFYPGKNLGAYGDGGAVLTQSREIADRVRRLRDHGSADKYRHVELGMNSRLDTLQAVVLRAKLRRLAAWNDRRGEAASTYGELLREVPDVIPPTTAPGNEHVWHLYVIRTPKRDHVLKRLRAAGVGAGIHYPVPLHLEPALSHLGYKKGDFPVAEKLAGELLSLPIYPGITPAQQEYVVDQLRQALA